MPIDLETAIRGRACDDGGRVPVTARIASDDAQRDRAQVLAVCLLARG